MKVVAAGWVLLSVSKAVFAELHTPFNERGLLDLLLPRPLVSSNLLQLTISSNNLLKHAKNIFKFANDNGGNRAFGSKGHNATVDYIKKLLDDTNYYDTELQTFPYLFSDGSSKFSAGGTDYAASWFTYGPAGDVTAPIVIVNNLGYLPVVILQTDFPASVTGKIALIKRGTCTFGVKIAQAGAAGAAGAIIYNNDVGPVGSGTLGAISQPQGPYVPMGGLSGTDGTALVAALSTGVEIIGKLHVDATTETRWTSNVLATSKFGNKTNVVMAGGHTDSVTVGPGINDDGSGSMALLEVALQLQYFKTKNVIRFAFWTAEEFGLVGSAHYAASLSLEEQNKIALYLNFDMIASPNAGYFVFDGDGSAFNMSGPAGSEHIEKIFTDYFKSHKLVSAPTAFTGRSDYGSFVPLGIPAGGLFTGHEAIKNQTQSEWWGGEVGEVFDKCYHKACDTLDNLNVPFWVRNTKAIAHAIATYGLSTNGIPRDPRGAPKELSRVSTLSYDDRKHQACGETIPTI